MARPVAVRKTWWARIGPQAVGWEPRVLAIIMFSAITIMYNIR